ncbi:hypothetical protein Ancab_001730 [Ancistrocladus abbreviatus]
MRDLVVVESIIEVVGLRVEVAVVGTEKGAAGIWAVEEGAEGGKLGLVHAEIDVVATSVGAKGDVVGVRGDGIGNP